MSKIISYKKLTNFKWLNLFKVQYENKNKEVNDWMVVSRNDDPFDGSYSVDAVLIVCFLDGKLVLIKQYRPALDRYMIENVAGLMEEGRTIKEIAEQEVKEEVGLTVTSYRIFDTPMYNTPGITNENIVCVIAEVEGEPTTEYNCDSEDIEILIVDRGEAKKLLDSGEIISAKCWFVMYAYAHGFDWLRN